MSYILIGDLLDDCPLSESNKVQFVKVMLCDDKQLEIDLPLRVYPDRQPPCDLANCVFIIGVSQGATITKELIYSRYLWKTIEDIVIPSKKPWALVQFQNKEDAKVFLEDARHFFWDVQVKGVGLVASPFNCTGIVKSELITVPQGLYYFGEFIEPEEEHLLLAKVGFYDNVFDEDKVHRFKEYGFHFNFETKTLEKKRGTEPVPEIFHQIILKKRANNIFRKFPEYVTVTHYHPGQGRPQQVEHPLFGEVVVVVTIAGDTCIDFESATDNSIYSRELTRRSALFITGRARYDWSNGIGAKAGDVINTRDSLRYRKRERRIEIILRTVEKSRKRLAETAESQMKREQACGNPEELIGSSMSEARTTQGEGSDSQGIEPSTSQADTSEGGYNASLVEHSYVRNVYSEIASHFNETRRTPWPKVQNFVESFPLGSMILDIGCGNARYFSRDYPFVQIGVDQAVPLVKVVQENGYLSTVGHCLHLPFVNDAFDGIISIAVYHHLASNERRLESIQELVRVLRDKGRALVYVWSRDQKADGTASHYARKQNPNDSKEEERVVDGFPVQSGRTKEFAHNDLLVPWVKSIGGSKQEYLRYYHLFEKGELDQLVNQVPFAKLINSYYDSGNWCVEIMKEYSSASYEVK